MNKEQLRASEAIAKNLGVRFCVKCNKTKNIEGGKMRVLASGNKRWECAACSKRKGYGII